MLDTHDALCLIDISKDIPFSSSFCLCFNIIAVLSKHTKFFKSEVLHLQYMKHCNIYIHIDSVVLICPSIKPHIVLIILHHFTLTQ